MIGQNNAINLIKSINVDNFPRIVSIIGRRGFGKSELVKYISNYLDISDIRLISSIDDVRDVIKNAPTLSHNTIIHIDSFEKLNFRAKEILLKLCEDVPKFIYIIIEVTNSDLFNDRFYNRSFIINLEPYSQSDIDNIILTFGDLSNDDINVLKSFLGSPKDIKSAIDFGNIYELRDFIYKVYNNVIEAEHFNAMKIADKLKLKANSDGIDFELFFNALYNIAFKDFYSNMSNRSLIILNASSGILHKISISNSLNKKALFDDFILSLAV